MTKNFTGYCPEQECEYTVLLKAVPIKVLNRVQPKYKFDLEYCEYYESNQCSKRLCELAIQANRKNSV